MTSFPPTGSRRSDGASRRSALFIIVWLIVIGLVGCSQEERAGVTDAEVSAHLDETMFRLPLDEPRARAFQLVAFSNYLLGADLRQCMDERGIAFPPPEFVVRDEPATLERWTRGVDELKAVGFQPKTSRAAEIEERRNQEIDRLIKDENVARAYGECSDMVTTRPGGYREVAMPIAQEYNYFSSVLAAPAHERAEQDKGYVEVLDRWRDCMESRGWNVDREEDVPVDDIDGVLASRDCDIETGRRKVLYRALVREELNELADHPAALQDLDERLGKLRRALDRYAERIGVDLPT
jgi:hypothetical protein